MASGFWKLRVVEMNKQLSLPPIILLAPTAEVQVFVSCKETKQNEIDFWKVLELYQSYGRNQGINRVEAKSNSKKRKEIFMGNFNQLTKYSKQNGFPEIGSMQTSGLDSC